MPDFDLDFETSRRHEVIEYLVKRYPHHASQICSYGLYRVDNLLNDLSKVCGNLAENKEELKQIKAFINKHFIDGNINMDAIVNY